MGRKLMVVGNWKMNKNLMEALTLASQIIIRSKKMSGTVEIVLAPPFPYLHTVNSMTEDISYVRVAAQDCHSQENGAFTGNVSASMLASMNLSYVILGHSERRKYHNESDTLIAQKVSAAIAEGLEVIFCCGEPLSIREAGTHKDFVVQQLKASLYHLKPSQMKQVVIAYEPIWAIGTGQTATAEQAQEMHAFIRKSVSEQYHDEIAQQCTILYGGSCNPANAAALFANKDVDGGLVGGASLKVEQFLQIIQARQIMLDSSGV